MPERIFPVHTENPGLFEKVSKKTIVPGKEKRYRLFPEKPVSCRPRSQIDRVRYQGRDPANIG